MTMVKDLKLGDLLVVDAFVTTVYDSNDRHADPRGCLKKGDAAVFLDELNDAFFDNEGWCLTRLGRVLVNKYACVLAWRFDPQEDGSCDGQ